VVNDKPALSWKGRRGTNLLLAKLELAALELDKIGRTSAEVASTVNSLSAANSALRTTLTAQGSRLSWSVYPNANRED
jgi:hypothetical protein